IRELREVDAGQGASPKPSNVSYSLARALHSLGNVYVEMCEHGKALANFDEALQLFARQGGVRHEAIVRKDQAWSHFILRGWADAETDLIRAVTDLGPKTTDADRLAENSTTHLAEGWLMLSTIRSLTHRIDGAEEAVERAAALISNGENP